MIGPGAPETILPTPRKDFPPNATLLGTLGENYSPYGVAAGVKPYTPSLFPFGGGVTVRNTNWYIDYLKVGTGIRKASEGNRGEQAVATPLGNILIADEQGKFVEKSPDIVSAGSGSVVRKFPSYPEDGFSSPKRIDRLAASPVNASHLFAVFSPQVRRRTNDLPQEVYFIDATKEKSPTFERVHFSGREHIVDLAAGQDDEGSELVAVVSKSVETSKTTLNIFNTKGQEITKVNNVTTVIAGEVGEFFYMDDSGKVFRLMESTETEGVLPTWQSELIFDGAQINLRNDGQPLFLTKAPEGKVVVVTRKGHVFLVDPQKPEKNGSLGTHYQLPETSETGKPLILCEAAATPEGGEGYAVMREGISAQDASYLLYQLYDLSPEPVSAEPSPATQE